LAIASKGRFLTRSTRVILLLAVFLAATLRAASPVVMPDALRRSGADVPFFVSARAVTDPSGGIQWSGFADAGTRMVLQAEVTERARRVSIAPNATESMTAPCAVRIMTFPDPSGAPKSLRELAGTAAAVYRGRVAGTAPGFNLSTPATLIAVEIAEAVRAADGFPKSGIVYVVYPAADFSVGGTRFCNAGVNGGTMPKVGDAIAVFAPSAPIDADGVVLNVGAEQIVFASGTRVMLPPGLREDRDAAAARSLDDLLQRAGVAACTACIDSNG
jgi:hypothetical protein